MVKVDPLPFIPSLELSIPLPHFSLPHTLNPSSLSLNPSHHPLPFPLSHVSLPSLFPLSRFPSLSLPSLTQSLTSPSPFPTHSRLLPSLNPSSLSFNPSHTPSRFPISPNPHTFIFFSLPSHHSPPLTATSFHHPHTPIFPLHHTQHHTFHSSLPLSFHTSLHLCSPFSNLHAYPSPPNTKLHFFFFFTLFSLTHGFTLLPHPKKIHLFSPLPCPYPFTNHFLKP